MAFTRTWNPSYEGDPDDDEQARLYAEFLRFTKVDIRERMDIEHDWGNGGVARHTFPMLAQGPRDALGDPVNGMINIRTGDSFLDSVLEHRNASGVWKPVLGYNVGTTAQRNALANVPTNFVFFDTDLLTAFRWSGTAWTEVVASIPVGTMAFWPVNNPPTGWLISDGSAESRTTYGSLFTVIGTDYGAGDGSTTFNLPNLKGRVIVGLDSGDTDFDTLGETGGDKEHDHTGETGGSTVNNTAFTNPGISFATGTHKHTIPADSSLQPYIVLHGIIKY